MPGIIYGKRRKARKKVARNQTGNRYFKGDYLLLGRVAKKEEINKKIHKINVTVPGLLLKDNPKPIEESTAYRTMGLPFHHPLRPTTEAKRLPKKKRKKEEED